MGYEETFAEAKNTAVRGSYPLKEVISVKNGITTQYFALEKSLLTSVKINVKKPSGKNFLYRSLSFLSSVVWMTGPTQDHPI
jgi:hypothetical protein